jgi:hypothetical protein
MFSTILGMEEADHLVTRMMLGLLPAIGILVGLYFLSKVTPKGTVLGIAVMLLVSAGFVGRIESAAGQFMAGILQLAGFAGFLLGLFNVFRKDRPRAAEKRPPKVLRPLTVTKDNLGDLEAVNRQMAGARFRFADIRHDPKAGLWELPFWVDEDPTPNHTLTVRGAVACVQQATPGIFMYDVGTVMFDAATQALRLEGLAPKTVIVRLAEGFAIGVA